MSERPDPGQAAARPPGGGAQELLVRFVRALPLPERGNRAAELQRARLLQQAHRALSLADEAMSALLSGDAALLDHKLRCLLIAGLGRPTLLELAVSRLRSLAGCELYLQHARSTPGRQRLAQTLDAFMQRYGAPGACAPGAKPPRA